jgi:hypothetical protein
MNGKWLHLCQLRLALRFAGVVLLHVALLSTIASSLVVACGARTGPEGFDVLISATGGTQGIGGHTYCTIDGIAYGAGAVNPADRCQRCQPSKSTASWSDGCVSSIAAGYKYTCAVVNEAAYCWSISMVPVADGSVDYATAPKQVQDSHRASRPFRRDPCILVPSWMAALTAGAATALVNSATIPRRTALTQCQFNFRRAS